VEAVGLVAVAVEEVAEVGRGPAQEEAQGLALPPPHLQEVPPPQRPRGNAVAGYVQHTPSGQHAASALCDLTRGTVVLSRAQGCRTLRYFLREDEL